VAKKNDREFRVSLRGLDLAPEESERIRVAVQRAALVELAELDVATGFRVQRLRDVPDLKDIVKGGQTDGIVAQRPEI